MSSNRIYAIEYLKSSSQEKDDYMIQNMIFNKAYTYATKNLDLKNKESVLSFFKNKYINYRAMWRSQPKTCINKYVSGGKEMQLLCVDIEVAAVCDLACPHCFRQHIVTPDKVMKKELAFNIIGQVKRLNVPSMKFNWRGEPLLNPDLPEIIDYAKQSGVLETIINTNATKLDEKNSINLINSGLDTLIFSFDGGTESSYQELRPGRFKENLFKDVYANIINFSKIRKKLNSKFPRTKIQMVLTEKTREEKNSFYKLFENYVDDISVKQYSERGGKIKDLNLDYFKNSSTPRDELIKSVNTESDVMKNINGEIFISEKRLPCEQPFQRLLISYDGIVSMCCYDWGNQHPVGFVDDLSFNNKNEVLNIKKKIENNSKGFQLMKPNIPKQFNFPKKIVNSVEDIWSSEDIEFIRAEHIKGNIEKIEVCKNCTFKETYAWTKVV
jgi:MoaA/NifB/PqqE/SkfB family radical SAM enzyme